MQSSLFVIPNIYDTHSKVKYFPNVPVWNRILQHLLEDFSLDQETQNLCGSTTDCHKSGITIESFNRIIGCVTHPAKNLKSIKGIGDLGSAILLSVIVDVNDFADEGKLAAYFGIVPRVSNSNETNRSGRITKRGNKLGRTTLVQCALIAKRYSPYLRNYYDRVKARRGTGKAIIDLARKFLNVIYNTLKNNWVWEDFPNGVLAESCA